MVYLWEKVSSWTNAQECPLCWKLVRSVARLCPQWAVQFKSLRPWAHCWLDTNLTWMCSIPSLGHCRIPKVRGMYLGCFWRSVGFWLKKQVAGQLHLTIWKWINTELAFPHLMKKYFYFGYGQAGATRVLNPRTTVSYYKKLMERFDPMIGPDSLPLALVAPKT